MGMMAKGNAIIFSDLKRLFFFLVLLFLAFSMGIGFFGYRLYAWQTNTINHDKRQELDTVAKLKIKQITYWLREQQTNAQVFFKNPFLAESIDLFLQDLDRDKNLSKIQNFMSFYLQAYDYKSEFILDRQGEVKWALPQKENIETLPDRELAWKSMKEKEVVCSNLYRKSATSGVLMDYYLPIFSSRDNREMAVGVVVLRVDPERFLFPLLQSWPTSSPTGETLLVRRAGNNVLFLNHLRHVNYPAMSFQLAMTRKDFPAAMAVRGLKGTVEGVDYRGVPVLAAMRDVPGTTWFIVSKIDLNEIYGPVRQRALETGLLTASLILAMGLALGVYGRNQQLRFQRERRDALQKEHNFLEVTLRSIGDAVIAADLDGHVVLINSVAETLTGWSQEQARGIDLTLVFQIVDEETRQPCESPLKKVIESGQRVHLSNHTILVSRDGTPRIIVHSTSPICDDKSRIYGAILVFRDITEHRLVENEREGMITLLRLLSSKGDLHHLMQMILSFLQKWSLCEAVGIRLRQGDDFPYFVTRGFSREFVTAENSLCTHDLTGQLLRDQIGNPVIECMCGNILCGRFDPSKPFFTEFGSFWSNCTTELLANTTQADRQARTRNRCNSEGYESVALIPLKTADATFGLIQLNDPQKGRFTAKFIAQMERMADSIAMALAQRKAEEALGKSEEKYRMIADFTYDWEFWLGVDGRYLYTSPSCERITGYRREEFQKDPELFFRIIHPEDRERIIAHMREVHKTSVAHSLDFRILTRTGEERWITHVGQPVYGSDGTYLGQRGSNRDITDRKKAEEEIRILNTQLEQRIAERTVELIAANKELEAFSYSVSHDLRAPLRSIDGFSRILIEDYANFIDNQGKDFLNRIVSASHRMSDLIDDLLRLSRVTQSDISRSSVDLSRMAQSLAGEFMESQPERKVEWIIEPNLVAYVDAALVRIVLQNLLANAWKFTGKIDQARIEFGIMGTGKEQTYFVRDNGSGFSMSHAKKLFGVFQRFHLRSDFDGTGIGLAIVQRIIHRHGGTIWAQSEVNQGATFYFTLTQSALNVMSEIERDFTTESRKGSEGEHDDLSCNGETKAG
jgi:PAS domain S-box-containing protein